MRSKLWRIIERLLVFLVGLGGIYFVVLELFPWLNERLPLVVALFVVYLLTAYIILPALIHIIRLFYKPMHIPAFTYTADGWKVDPVNIGIVATEEEFLTLLHEAGWHLADKTTLSRMFKMGLAIVLRRSYPTAPMGTHFLFGRPQDYGFEIPIGKSPHRRHHVRFWACVPVEHPTFKEHLVFWQERHKRKLRGRKLLWVGAATKDIGLAVKRRNLQIDHNIQADTAHEREFTIETIKETGKVKQIRTIRSHNPYYARHQTFMTRLIADGNIKICELQ